jgi:hypothetical protein
MNNTTMLCDKFAVDMSLIVPSFVNRQWAANTLVPFIKH